MDAAENEDAAALCRQRIDDGFDLAERFAGVELRLHIVLALEQFEIGDRFETHHLVAAGGVDHQIAGDGEQIGPAGGHIFPVFGGIGAGKNLRHHILQFLIGRDDPAEAPA